MGRLTGTNNDYCFFTCYENEDSKIREDCQIYNVCYERQMYEKLKHYEELEAEGRLVKLPFDVGDTAWILLADERRIVKVEIEQVVIGKTLDVILLEGDMQFTIWDKDWEVVKRFFFASREEAEAALKGVE